MCLQVEVSSHFRREETDILPNPFSIIMLCCQISLSHTHTQRQMEGIIPFVYRIIIQHRSAAAGQSTMADSWFSESPTLPYMRLPGDSGYMGLLPEPTNSPLLGSRHIASTGCLSALCFSTSRRAFS